MAGLARHQPYQFWFLILGSVAACFAQGRVRFQPVLYISPDPPCAFYYLFVSHVVKKKWRLVSTTFEQMLFQSRALFL